MVQPLSRKDHGGDAVSFGICWFFRCASDKSHSRRKWRKLAASVGDCGRDFCFVCGCRVSFCERTSRRPGPSGGWRAGRGAIGEVGRRNCPGHKICMGASTSLQHTRVLDDSHWRDRLPIPVFLLYCTLAAALERSWHSSGRCCICHGPFHARGRVRPVDWRMADGRYVWSLRVHSVMLRVFLWVVPLVSFVSVIVCDTFT